MLDSLRLKGNNQAGHESLAKPQCGLALYILLYVVCHTAHYVTRITLSSILMNITEPLNLSLLNFRSKLS